MSLLWNDDLSFLYSGIGILEKARFFLFTERVGGENEQSKKSKI